MQDLSYLATNGVLTFDPNLYLNGQVVGGPSAQRGNRFLSNSTKMQAQPTSDNFISRNKSTIKKVAAGAILVGVAAYGLNAVKGGSGKISEGLKKLGSKITQNNFLKNISNKVTTFVKDIPNKAKNIFKKV